MKILGNIIWFIFGGWLIALEYFLAGILACLTIIGIPFGLQFFKLAGLSLFPFGKDVLPTFPKQIPGCLGLLLNIIWLCTGGLCIALSHIGIGLFFCITIIGIPFGIQHFKLVSLAIWPFGQHA